MLIKALRSLISSARTAVGALGSLFSSYAAYLAIQRPVLRDKFNTPRISFYVIWLLSPEQHTIMSNGHTKLVINRVSQPCDSQQRAHTKEAAVAACDQLQTFCWRQAFYSKLLDKYTEIRHTVQTQRETVAAAKLLSATSTMFEWLQDQCLL